jgi:hypothetical protein
MENDGKGHFKNVGAALGPYFSIKRSGRGLATLDYDNDGDRDIIISHVDLQATCSLLRNDGGNQNNWLGMLLVGKNGPAAAIGAKVTLVAGGKKQVFVNQWSTSYLSNNDPRILAGLGKQKTVESIEINWSDGTRQVLKNIPSNKYITIKQK